MERHRNNKKRVLTRWVVSCALIFFSIQLILPIALVPKQADALFGVGDVSITVGDVPRLIWQTISSAVKTAADVAFRNMIRGYLNEMAYYYANKIATGQPGQKPQFTVNPKELLNDTFDAAAGDFLDNLARSAVGGKCAGYPDMKCQTDPECPPTVLMCPDEPGINPAQCGSSVEEKRRCISAGCFEVESTAIAGQGLVVARGAPECQSELNLCEPRDITTKVNLNLWARQSVYGTLTPRCPLSEIIDNVEATTSDRLVEVSNTFNPEASDVGMLLQIQTGAYEQAAEERKNLEFKKSLEGEIEPTQTTISGETSTPAVFVERAQTTILDQSLSETLHQTGSMVADVIGTFTNTLTSKLLEQYLNPKKGYNPAVSSKTKSIFSDILRGSTPGATAARELFATLQEVNYTSGGQLDILSKLASCPDPNDPTPDTCVIDARFRTAIEQRLTVREAIEQGLLSGTKPFGFDANGNEPDYVNGYPYRSLVILRSYRVLPVGWELAAKYNREYGRGNYSLSTLISEYDNEDSPFYKLVDPNWVLKLPEVYCASQGAGPKIQSDTAVRNEDTNGDQFINTFDAATSYIQRESDYCADEQQCLRENEDGSCEKYGYCIEEEPVWRFEGTACDPQYNSCESLTRSDGEEALYLTNTIDVNGCNANNAGCSWYCTDYNNATGQWSCANQAPTDGYPIVSLNMHAEECSAESDGCSQLMSIAGSGVNLLRNSGFEQYFSGVYTPFATDGIRDSGLTPADGGTSEPDIFADWGHYQTDGALPCGNRILAASTAFDGSIAARIHSYGACVADPMDYTEQIVDSGHLTDGRTFTASFYARTADDDPGCGSGGRLDVLLRRLINETASTYSFSNSASILINSQWTRYTAVLSFASLPETAWNGADIAELQREFSFLLRHSLSDTCDIVIDNVQLEESGSLSAYKSYENSVPTYLQEPPAYLGCTGNPATDDPECENFALVCSADEVGCNAYTAASTGEVVNGIITSSRVCDPADPSSCDQCPAEYVGCQAYRELAIERTPRRPVRDPVSFVGSTGDSCPATAVGCEEYTNLEAVAAGGEGKEYYSYIRMCVEEDAADPSLGTYYTWEASEEFGFQLRQYRLKVSNAGSGAPCTNMAPENPGIADPNNRWPNCVDGETFDENSDGIDEAHDARVCGDSCDGGTGTCVNSGIACTTDQECIDHQMDSDPDCTEFYDSGGTKHYVLKSYVVYASDECKSYRNSNDPADVLYHMVPGEGISCSAAYAGCRAYKGNAGDNSRSVYKEDFEDGTTGKWLGASISNSNESLVFGGHSLLIPSQAYIGSPLVDYTEMRENYSYTITFWAKGSVANTAIGAYVSDGVHTYQFSGESVARAGDWNRFELGPLYIEPGSGIPQTYSLYLDSSNAFYVDNIEMREVYDSLYRIRDSYASCSGYENCDRYTDVDRNTHYLKSFSRLCSEDKVGCEAFFDTQNSTETGATVYRLSSEPLTAARGDMNANGSIDIGDLTVLTNYLYINSDIVPTPADVADVNADGRINEADLLYLNDNLYFGGPFPTPAEAYPSRYIPADATITLVNDANKGCVAGDKGCSRLGSPTIDVDGGLSYYTDVYLKNNPDLYDSILCSYNDNMCEEYTTAGGAKLYFKNPGAQVCEYKRVVGQNTSGWYKVGTEQGVPDCPLYTGVCVGGADDGELCSSFDIRCDSGVCENRTELVPRPANGWVGLCSSAAVGCTEFRDPEEPTGCDATLEDGTGVEGLYDDCESYYYIDETIDQSSCNGLVAREEGCRLFNNTSSGDLVYDSAVSEDGSTPVLCTDPADCDSNTIVKVRKDRECGKWLECKMSERTSGSDGKVEELCLARYICSEMDEDTGHCIEDVDFEYVNQTYSSPAFVEEIGNYSGYVLAGLEWGLRCKNDPGVSCEVDADCPVGVDGNVIPNACQQQIVEGYLPYPAMEEVGAISISGDIVKSGDMGDSNYRVNQLLSLGLSWIDSNAIKYADRISQSDLTCAPPCPYSGELWPISWYPKEYGGSTASVWLAEESAENQIPSLNGNLDENNVLDVAPGGVWTGAYYNLGTAVNRGDEYGVTFSIRTAAPPLVDDRITIQIDYRNEADANIGYYTVGSIQANTLWDEYTFGPFTVGFDDNGDEMAFSSAWLSFVYTYEGTPGDEVPSEFFLDDVTMEPFLRANYDLRCRGGDDDGFKCETDADCAAPGICYDNTLIERDCRLYPSADAPYCEYVDENNTTHRGWQGYCLERDPGNPKYCLNWWPVDLLKGESSALSTLPRIESTLRTPMYMCLASHGNYLGDTNPFGGSYANIDGGGRYIYRETNQLTGSWIIEIISSCFAADWCEISGCDDYDALWNARNTPVTFAICRDDNNFAWRTPEIQIFMEDIEKVEFLTMYDHCNHSLSSGTPGFTIDAGGVQRQDTDGDGCHPVQLRKRIVAGESFLCPLAGASCIVWEAIPINCVGVRDCVGGFLSFAPAMYGNRLLRYGYRHNDDTGEHRESADIVVDFYLRETCQEYVKVVDDDGSNKAWFSRVSSSSDYVVAEGVAGSPEYVYGTDYPPFGSAVPARENCEPNGGSNDLLNPEAWDASCAEPGYQPLLVQLPYPDLQNARGGSPLGYNYMDTTPPIPPSLQTTPSGMCITALSHSRNGDTCSNVSTDCCENWNETLGRCEELDSENHPIYPKCVGFSTLSGEIAGGNWGAPAIADGALLRLFAYGYGKWGLHSNISPDVDPPGVCVGGSNPGTGCSVPEDCTGGGTCSRIQHYHSRSAWAYQNPFNTMAPCTNNIRPNSYPNDYCGVVPEVTVVAGTGGNMQPDVSYINLGPDGGEVQLNLTINANPDQLPIRLIEVDWGEPGKVYTTSGSFGSGTLTLTNNYRTPGTHVIQVRVVDNWDWCGIDADGDVDCAVDDCRYMIDGDGCDPEYIDTEIRVNVGS
ncbi:MAG: dockerin type I domain-containing protein [Patescibacteria group bacterium]